MTTQTINTTLYRIVLEMDGEWFEEFAKLASYRVPGEILRWISTDIIDTQIEHCLVCSQVSDEDGNIEHDEWAHDNVEN